MLAKLLILTAPLALPLPSFAQNNQSIDSFSCSAELSVVLGNAFQASCTGDLTIKSSSVVEAVGSISISADGNITNLGTLVAPNIRLAANGTTIVSGGLFSGSNEFFPVVTAISQASGMATVSTFTDLVPAPFVDTVYGAATFYLFQTPILPPIEAITVETFTSYTGESPGFTLAASIPEPSTYAMLSVGLLALLGRVSISRRAHSLQA